MVTKKIISLLLTLIFIALPSLIIAEKMMVVDDAALFTASEMEDLENKLLSLSDEYNMDIVVVTALFTDGKTATEYADDYFDYEGYGRGDDYSGILFLIDMDNREVAISTSGQGIRYLTDERIENILDQVFDSGLTREDFYSATMGFYETTSYYLSQGIPSNQHIVEGEYKPPNKVSLVDLLISLAGSLGLGGLFQGSVRSQYKFKNPGNPFSYKANSIVNIASQNDKLLDSIVTTRNIPRTPPPGSGSSGGGRSSVHRGSSGRMHGGGSRKF